jgi:hypothetical protein
MQKQDGQAAFQFALFRLAVLSISSAIFSMSAAFWPRWRRGASAQVLGWMFVLHIKFYVLHKIMNAI